MASEPHPKLEAVARALISAEHPLAEYTTDGLIRQYLPHARAAIEALLDPTEDQIAADPLSHDAAITYNAMLRKVLGDD
jgi:hypothetical protein